MKFKKNGFTLVEILGVIVILGILLILAFPSIIKQVKTTTSDIDKATKDLITSSAVLYIRENRNDYPITKNNVYCIAIQILIDSGELVEDLIDAKTGKKIDTTKVVKINVENETNIVYTIVNYNQCTEVRNG